MLKKDITYEDFNGDTVTETFYFNISKPELYELESEFKDGMKGFIEQIFAAKDKQTIIKLFKRIILLAYGEKSVDGKRFVKSDELRLNFEQSAAYPVLFMELATDDDSAAKFMTGIMPKDLAEEAARIAKEEAEKTPSPT